VSGISRSTTTVSFSALHAFHADLRGQRAALLFLLDDDLDRFRPKVLSLDRQHARVARRIVVAIPVDVVHLRGAHDQRERRSGPQRA